MAGESGAQPMSYTDTNGITFTVTAKANAGQTVNVQNVGLAVTGGSSETRIDGSESLELALSVSGGNLASLSASFLVGSLGTDEGFDVTDGTSTVVIAELADSLVEYGTGKELDGLVPLTESNVSTWSINFSVNAGYPDTKGILNALLLNYTVATETNPPVQYPLYAEADQLYSNNVAYDLTSESYSYSEIFRTETYPYPVFNDSHGTPLVSWNDSTFVVFADAGRRVKIAKITGDTVEEAYLDNVEYQTEDFYANSDGDPDNDIVGPDFYRMIEADGHHDLCMSIDKDGYIHIVGDMHNFPDVAGNMDHLPMRYFNSHCLYWRSDNPGDISSFSFKGDDPTTCPQGYGFTYLQFHKDLEGELFFSSRAFQGDPAKRARRAQATSRYDAENGTWSIVGGKAFEPDGYDVTFWEDNAEGGGSYVKMYGDLSFDRENKMHMATGILNYDADVVQTVWAVLTDLLYLQSTDGGLTMKKTDGSVVSIPARAEAGANQAEIIYTTDYLSDPDNQEYLNAPVQIAHDISNNPYVLCKPKHTDGLTILSQGPTKLFGWSAAHGWTGYEDVVSDYQYFFTDPAGVMTVINESKVTRFWDAASNSVVTADWDRVKAYDREYVKMTGNLQVLCEDTATGELVVKRMEITRPGLGLITPPTDPVTNHPPEITGAATINGTALSVAATDADGDPLTYTWSMAYGPADVSFSLNGTEASSNTVATFTQSGSYELKVAVSDGIETRISTCSFIHVAGDPNAPRITTEANASPAALILGETAALSVGATNAAAGGNAIYTWLKSSGPGSVSFSVNGTTSSSTTEASFDATGTYELQVTISNSAGTASSSCTVDVNGLPPVPANGYLAIDFSSQAFESFVNDNEFFDRTGTVEVVESGAGVRFIGDLWKAFPIDYQMTADTVLEFDFSCLNEGELHAIAMTDTPSWDFTGSRYDLIKLHGTDSGLYIMDRDGGYTGGTNRYSIAIGQLLTLNTEQKNYLDFVNADNSGEITPDAQSTFANVIIYEPAGDADGDGQSNLAEIRLGTDPADAASMFGINGGTVLPDLGKIRISWPSQADIQYRVSASPDLAEWNVVRGWAVAQTPPEDVFEADLAPSNGFFKVEAQIQ
ncbi:hypothetical protein SCARR_00688 [Pontiella sulfatireligans]|uniref:PKD domain-containing protein n=2 Tax=Pontiella sulfatireligans TaxID=2750658 RepID=A0A6C2UEQ1_9BACT|nr:hypothetical protein SCARR_00688 [Pontiella sulfatireligans]